MFERFYRVEQSRNRKIGGFGLGLSFVKAIITAHGANIVVKSKPDIGTTFIVSIPSE
jgi:two-component system OmpR family sensor kinase